MTQSRNENTPFTVPLAVVVLLLLAPAAPAGIVDSPIPTGFTQHVYSVPGVINSGGVATIFWCTNSDSSSVTVGVEVFGAGGGDALNNAAATAISLAPGATVSFGTSNTQCFSVDASLADMTKIKC